LFERIKAEFPDKKIKTMISMALGKDIRRGFQIAMDFSD
jgi:hypothetical protein